MKRLLEIAVQMLSVEEIEDILVEWDDGTMDQFYDLLVDEYKELYPEEAEKFFDGDNILVKEEGE